jgi:mannose-6-phosphate isomerase-like protein (cupin superfamily)
MIRILITLAIVVMAAPAALGQEHVAAKTNKTPAKTTMTSAIYMPKELAWANGPYALPAGAKIAVLSGDPMKSGPFTIRLMLPDGYRVPPHSHPTAEEVTVISGTFHVGMGDKFDESTARELPAGSFVTMPKGMRHYAWGTGETVVQINSMGPFAITYVNPTDDPRKGTTAPVSKKH